MSPPATEVVVVDSDVYSILYVVAGRSDSRRDSWRRLLLGKTVVIAAQTRGEILAGALIGGWGQKRYSALRAQLDTATMIPVDARVIDTYAQLAAACRRAGHPLGDKHHDSDRWIAATTVAVGGRLLSGDGIYRDAPGLRLLDE